MRSLRADLLVWLMLPLLVLLAVNLADARYRAAQTATLVTDRLLLASARVIAEQIRDVDGHIDAPIPPAALEMFASPYMDKVVYQVTAPSGELVAGYPDVAPPARRPGASEAAFDARFRVDDVRALCLSQPVVAHARAATVIVATTLRARDAMSRELWLRAAGDQVLIVVAAGALMVMGLSRGLAPLRRLSEEVLSRDALSLAPVALGRVQAELRPLLAALNHALDRVAQHVALQRRFIANAAHQLRTPLTVLKTQAAVGLRDPLPEAKDEALAAVEASANGMAHLVNQLLTLARAEPGGNSLRTVMDAVEETRLVLGHLAIVALDRGVELTLRANHETLPVVAHRTLLQDMVTNLVANALDATPRGGTVEVLLARRDGRTEWVVEDTGPGISPEHRTRVFERFYRLPGSPPGGTGLGLAIVAEVVQAHGGRVELAERVPRPGLSVRVSLPAVTTAPPSQEASRPDVVTARRGEAPGASAPAGSRPAS